LNEPFTVLSPYVVRKPLSAHRKCIELIRTDSTLSGRCFHVPAYQPEPVDRVPDAP
jgi:hypothetical protein